MLKQPDQILLTVKVIFSAEKPLSYNQIAYRTKLSRRTVERHVKRLRDAEMVNTTKSKVYHLESLYQKSF